MIATAQAAVKEFMVLGGQEAPSRPTHEIDGDLMVFRANLMGEELDEFVEAFMQPGGGSMVGMVDALADLLYVTLGTAVSLGVDLDPIFRIVHEANMAKYQWCYGYLGAIVDDPKCGSHKLHAAHHTVLRNEAGKVQKPEGWVGPETAISIELTRQATRPTLILPGSEVVL